MLPIQCPNCLDQTPDDFPLSVSDERLELLKKLYPLLDWDKTEEDVICCSNCHTNFFTLPNQIHVIEGDHVIL